MRLAFSLKSRNAKTGNIPVSTSPASTCPSACPLKYGRDDNGNIDTNKPGPCYAKYGPLGMFWAKVNDGRAGMPWADFLTMVRSLPEGQLWRHNQSGDLPGADNTIDRVSMYELIEANMGRKGFTYTHKPMDNASNRDLVSTANAMGFTINLSADTLSEADELAALNIGPVVVVVPRDAENMVTPEGRKVVICPAQRSDDVTCKSCGLCANASRSSIVGFRAHGVSAKKAEAISMA